MITVHSSARVGHTPFTAQAPARLCVTTAAFALAGLGWAGGAAAQEESGAADLAAAFQDPLANISAIFTDNTIGFDTGADGDDESYEFNIQPVYSLNFIEGVTIIPRAMIPIVGVRPGTDLPRLGEDGIFDEPKEKGRQWGMSDIVTQFFITPTGQEGWTWGVGPMIS